MAGAPLDRTGSVQFAIADLVSWANEGSIRVPTFQRQFVWTERDVRDLFDSIYRGFPIGTLLLWRRDAPGGSVTLGPISLTVPPTTNALWVVDGQQRITSLFAALSPHHAEVDDRFEVYFDLVSKRFIGPRGGVAPARAVPVRRALETRSLLQWTRSNEHDLELEDLELIDRLGGELRDYKVPAYIVVGDDQALLREVFDRVNSAGKPISRAEVFHALFARDELLASPASVIVNLRSQNFGDFDEGRIVQSMLAMRGGNVQRDLHDEFSGDEDPADWYDLTEQALARVIGFLKANGVVHLLLVPNSLPIPVLAAFFHLHPEPEPWVLRLLARWLWRGWVHGFGKESGQTPVMRRAIRSVHPAHRDPDAAPSPFEAVKALLDATPDRPTPRLDLDNFRTNEARSRLIMLAMSALRPRGPAGEAVDVVAEFQKHGANAVTEFVPGHRTRAAARGFWPTGGSVTELPLLDEAVLESQAIDLQAARKLGVGDVEGFLRRREELLNDIVYRYLDSRLEPEALVRPPLRDLVTADGPEGRSDG